MLGSLKRTLLIGLMGVMSVGAAAAQESAFRSDRPKGLIPLDAEQEKKILTTWPRVERVHLNWLGLERINKVRTARGKTPLDRCRRPAHRPGSRGHDPRSRRFPPGRGRKRRDPRRSPGLGR